MLGGGRDRFATAAYGTLTRLPEGRWEFTVASGGHPLPVVARADGGTASIGEPGTLLGVFEETSAVPVTTVLNPGDAIVLYTDGITDRPPPYDIDTETVEHVIAFAARSAPDAATLADTLQTRLEQLNPIPQREDDVALLVIRL
jgi:sigma-B regulation protein RsbU (phosphoserine phosphatase)